MNKIASLLLITYMFFTGNAFAAGIQGDEVKVASVKQAQMLLNGEWKLTLTPPEGFWRNEVSPDKWNTISVPGELSANGFPIEYDKPFVYKKQIAIPADYAGHRILLHFDGVFNYAKVWVNGKEVGEHQGGFTAWDADITDAVKPGETAWVTLAVTSLSREISFAGKALRNIGGILRDVELRARPATFIDALIVSTKFDKDYRDATLRIAGTVSSPDKNCEADFRLFDSKDNEVSSVHASIKLSQTNSVIEIPVSAPAKWDAEHPNLYRLQVDFRRNGVVYATYSKRVGFRELTFDAKHNLLLNGQIVKLRGINRHIQNPLRGKVTTQEYDLLDAQLIKEANMNFVRTSHYPPGERFIEYCDQIGLYVTVESAVVDVGKKNRPSVGMNDDPQYEKFFLSQLREMVDTYGSHPAVIIWSLCNESVFGNNFRASAQLVRKLDFSRPVVASYQVIHDTKHETYDIESRHYPAWNTDFTMVERPTIYDEWMHVLGHTANLWFHDPNGRDYWGRSLDKAWSALFEADGSIGAAIWHYVDDVTYLPNPEHPENVGPTRFLKPDEVRFATPENPSGAVFGTGHWGIVDEWRRKKPEFWNVQKAYSPVRISDSVIQLFERGKDLLIPVHNRFDQTNLNELKMEVQYKGKTVHGTCNDLAPHQKGFLRLPAMDWQAGDSLVLKFFDNDSRMIDAYTLQIGEPQLAKSTIAKSGVLVKIVDKEGRISVFCGSARYDFDKVSGLLQNVECSGVKYPVRGPFMHMYQWIENRAKESGFVSDARYDPDPDTWKCLQISGSEKEGTAVVSITGSYGDIDAGYVFVFHTDGSVEVTYNFKNLPVMKIPLNAVTQNKTQMLEFGIKFQVGDQFDELVWKRKGYWNWYPEGHQGSLEGRVPVFSDKKPVWRQKPNQPWEMDVHDFIHQGSKVPAGRLLPNTVRGTKMGIYDYQLIDTDAGVTLAVTDNGQLSCRLMQQSDQHYYLQLLDNLDYAMRWGNYSARYEVTPNRTGKILLEIKN